MFVSQETVAKGVEVLSAVLADPHIKEALVALASELAADTQLVQSVTEMALGIIARDDIYNVSCTPLFRTHCSYVPVRPCCTLSQATTELLVKSSAELLADETVRKLL